MATSFEQVSEFDLLQIKNETEIIKNETIKVLEEAELVLDSIENLEDIGILNASTGVATIETGTVTLTATPPTAWLNGQEVTVTVSGSIGFAGINFTSGTVLNIGDKLRKRGTYWELVPFSVGDGTITGEKLEIQIQELLTLLSSCSSLIQFDNEDLFQILDATRKKLLYIDYLGKINGLFNLQDNAVSTNNILDGAVSAVKLEPSLQELITLLSSFSSFDLEFQSDNVFQILDSVRKVLFAITNLGKVKAQFDYSLSPINFTDLSEELKNSVFEQSEYNSDFNDYVFYIQDKTRKVILGIKQDGSVALTTSIFPSTIGLLELKDEVKNRLLPTKSLIKAGDSLTRGAGGDGVTDLTVLQSLMPDFVTINAGVGGETVPTISARLGGVTCLITEGFTLPSDLSAVTISSVTNVRLKDSLGKNITPLIQGSGLTVNPSFVEGIECTLSWTGSSPSDTAGTWTIKRNVAGTSKVIKPNSPLIFYGSYAYNNASILVIEMGQNGGYADLDEYVYYVNSCISNFRKSNFIIVGQHTGTPAGRATLEARCLKEWGNRYINMREYISGNAMYDLGLTPTTDDLTAMANGTFPPSLWASPTDSIHGNANFYTAKGTKIFTRIKELNYL